jgi:hypothetical protein
MSIQWNQLVAHFDVKDVDFKPQTFSKDGQKCLAIAFVDPRRYQERLDDVVGIANWSVEYRSIGESTQVEKPNAPSVTRGAVVARISVFDPDTGRTIVREEVGEFDGTGMAMYPTASAQAFKRACVTLGLGRYLYDLPQTWAQVENRRITDAEITRMRGILAKMGGNTPTPQTTPQKPVRPGAQANLPTGQQGMQNARAISRIAELVGDAKDAGIDVKLPANWQSLPYPELVELGKKVTAVLAEEGSK